jgi:hypothetical protein
MWFLLIFSYLFFVSFFFFLFQLLLLTASPLLSKSSRLISYQPFFSGTLSIFFIVLSSLFLTCLISDLLFLLSLVLVFLAI